MRRRLKGGHVFWHDELFFCEARRAFGFVNPQAIPNVDGDETAGLDRAIRQCAFRRLFCDRSLSVVRLEVGLRGDTRPTAKVRPSLTGAQCEKLANHALDQGVRPGYHGVKQPPDCKLRDLIRHVPAHYELATTRMQGRKKPPPAGRFVLPCLPMLLLVYNQGEVQTLPSPTREWPIPPDRVNGADIAFMWLRSGGSTYPYWFLREDSTDPSTARRIRLGLLRLHAEFQVLQKVLRLFLKSEFRYQRETTASNRFDAYLQQGVRLLSKDEHGGISLREIQEIIAADSLVRADEMELLRSTLEQVRGQIAQNALKYAGKKSNGPRNGRLWAVLRELLIALFPSRPELAMLVDDSLSVNLDAVASNNNLTETVFDLINWARIQPQDRLQPLLAEAVKRRPESTDLKALQDELFKADRTD